MRKLKLFILEVLLWMTELEAAATTNPVLRSQLRLDALSLERSIFFLEIEA